MAILKQYVFVNKLLANYHRITEINKNEDVVRVMIASYISEESRNEEIELRKLYNDYTDAVNAGDEEKAQAIRDSIEPDRLNEILSISADYAVAKFPVMLSYKDDLHNNLSFESVYSALMKRDEFKNGDII